MLDAFGALNKLPTLSENILERNPSYWKSLNCIALQELAPCLWQDVFIPVIAKHYEQFKNMRVLQKAPTHFSLKLFAYCDKNFRDKM